jgi:hypothetical protein
MVDLTKDQGRRGSRQKAAVGRLQNTPDFPKAPILFYLYNSKKLKT